MKLRELFEAPATAVMAFGRMNPPTIGHAKLVDTIKSQPGDPFIFLSQSQKPKTDPLSFEDKLRYAKFFFPNVTIGNPEVKTIIQALQKINQLGYENLIYVAGSDRVQSFEELINKYNGQEYNFKSIKVVSAGERDPDADGAEGMSASKMRAAAAAGDLESFKQGVPNQEVADEMFNAVRKGMGVKDVVAAEDVSPENEKKFHNELDDLVHKYFGDSPDEEKMKKKYKKTDEILGFATRRPKTATITKRRPPEEDSVQDKIKKSRAMAAKGDDNAFKSNTLKVKEDDLNEAVPLVAAAIWIIKWAIRYGAWPVIKWLLKKHGGKIIGGAAAAYYIDQGWDWVKDKIGAEYAQMLIDNKFEIGMAVALIIGAVALKKYMEKQGDKLVKANESLMARS